MTILEQLQFIKAQFFKELAGVENAKTTEELKISYFGKKGKIASVMADLKNVPKEQKPLIGKTVNEIRNELTSAFEKKVSGIEQAKLDSRIAEEALDVTAPGREPRRGKEHLLLSTLDQMCEILKRYGFTIEHSLELESEFYNYESLNYPPHHPARDMQDTYYVTPDILMRSHTTSFQRRVLDEQSLPLRCATAGKCYRNETISMRSHVIFHQLDVLYVDKGVSLKDLLSLQQAFYRELFGSSVKIRVRPSYFPFVEPGVEVDISCTSCSARGCALCKLTGWLEVSGAGIVHPQILKQANVDTEKYSGFAWGSGIERIAMLLHDVKDIRLFLDNDERMLNQF